VRGVTSARVKQVWSTDITSLRLHAGFVSWVAVMDWFSRSVLAWEVSVTLDRSVCVSALERALIRGQPEIFNSDHGAPFTSRAFLERLKRGGMRLSLDGRGRALDNVFVERLWRSMKYEEVYRKDDSSVQDASNGLRSDVDFYNRERLHQSLNDQTPAAVYRHGERQTAIATFN
jgi:putative transposase